MRAALAALALLLATPAAAQECTPDVQSHAVSVSGEVAGDRAFREGLPNGWVFALLPAPHGWWLRVQDGAEGVDLTALTPPLRGPANPRDLFGWHFRNAGNTGPNSGDVNAPQHMRAFVVSPGIAGTGGLRPPEGPVAPSPDDGIPDDGIGWLKIIDMGLADLEPGQRARMTYLKFDACLRWPKTEEEQRMAANEASPVFIDEEIEVFGACGLDLSLYALDAAILPRMLGGDIDGDDAGDEIAQITRRSDGARGLALCRAGTWMHVLGMDGAAGLRPGYIGQMEAWRWLPRGETISGYDGAPPWPEPEGGAIALERIEKELVLLYWKDGGLRSQQVYRFVEP